MSLLSYEHPINDIGKYELHRVAKDQLPAGFSPGVQFVKVHIRIDTPSYQVGQQVGFQNNEDKKNTQANIGKVLSDAGMDVSFHRAEGWSNRVFNVTEGNVSDDYSEDLFIHPQDLSGIISMDRMVTIAHGMSACKTSSLRWIDIYAFPEGLSVAEKTKRLKYYEPDLIRAIIKRVNTGKRRAYIDVSVFTENGIASTLPGLQFIENYSRNTPDCPVTTHYLENLFFRLIKEGVLLMAEQQGRRFYRAPLKSELKAIKKTDRTENWSIAEQVLWAD